MNVSPIGITTIAPTTGTPAERPEDTETNRNTVSVAPDRAQDQQPAPRDTQAAAPPPPARSATSANGYGALVDKHV